MSIFVISDNSERYRVRKEDSGCTIFSTRCYLEANDTVYEVLRLISEKGVKGCIDELYSLYPDESDEITNDLIELAENFTQEGVFLELSKELKTALYAGECEC